ncbi:hypothetical protein GC173_08675, partial [bacterium]|nr:hypothetical protein [bacterium]
MHQLTDPGWWLSFASIWLPWYLFCVVASVVALPLCLRVYRGLADRGASLSIGIGLLAMNLFSWLVSIEWFGAQGPAGKVRVIWIAGGAVATVATLILQGRGRASGWLSWVPAALLFLIGFAWLPHGFASALFGLVATGLLSALAWQGDRPGLFREVRLNAAPLLVSHLLFLVGFAFFANVRSYIPYATYDRGLFLAEKWGNYQHLSAIFRSTTLPPRDLWFSGAWTNYYYGGHLLTATIAKAIGTPQYIAFNLGLATIFALTLSMGFGFVYSLVRLASVRSRIGRHLAWHHGMGWALFGAAAIALFGNLDPWRQLLTRDSDYGAQQRITRRITSEQEEWKLTHGVPAETVMALRASVAAVPEPDRLSALVGEIARQRQQRGDLSATHRKMLESAGAVMADQSLDRRARENALLSILVPSTNTPLYRNLLSVNSVEIEEELAREITAGEFDAALKRFEAIPVSDNEVPALEALGNKADELLEQQVASAAFDGIDILLADETRAKGLSELTHLPVDDLRSTWSTAAKRPREQAAIVREWLALMEENSGAVPDQGNAEETLRDALGDAPAAVDVDSLIRAVVGSFPPDVPSDFDSAAFRYSWENVSQIDFWAPSRAIKGTPPGVAEEGTITEFPYFSALLGDHHPHHMALAWTLAALAACVSVLRRTSRRCADEAVWLGRALPGLVMMALLIGYVFSVNIWDAVVLAPIYALVVCVSRRGVRPLPEWRWVGLAGFALLIPLVLCLLVNASPVTVPLFQEFKAFLLAWALVGIGIPVALYLMPSRSPLLIVGVLCSLALALVIAGAIIAPGIGGETPVSPVYTGLRDGLVFLIAVALAALWTLRDERSDWANWWYGCGFVYMVVGLTALLLAAPFKAFFQTPLFPSVRLLNTATPPTIGFELVERPDIFWTMFWRASPVNPFPWGLRTELGDFFLHWGIFLIPVLVFAVWRVLTMLRDSEPAKGLCLLAIPLAIAAFARIYLQYWTGALCLALVPVALWLAVGNRRRAEGPAWVLLAGAFLWCWFVEALHFDDDYSGNYERYNTPFKIYYPLWPIFAGAMVVALRETAARFAIQRSSADEALQSPNFWLCAAAIGVGVPLACAHVFPNAIAQWIFFVLIIP